MSQVDSCIDAQSGPVRAPRHARLFDLIRHHNLAAAMRRTDAARPAQFERADTVLNRDEQRALGITPSFGR